MKQTTAQIMSQVDKAKAIQFVLNMKQNWAGNNLPPSQFGPAVVDSLASIGIVVTITAGTANAVCTKMERKAGMDIL